MNEFGGLRIRIGQAVLEPLALVRKEVVGLYLLKLTSAGITLAKVFEACVHVPQTLVIKVVH